MNLTAPVSAATALLFCATGTTTVAATETPSPGPVVSAAIRCTNGQYNAIDDTGHTPRGIVSVVTASSYIEVHHAPLDPVGSMQVTADETYVLNGYRVGASVGIDRTRIYFSNGSGWASPASACLDWSNVWVTGWAGDEVVAP